MAKFDAATAVEALEYDFTKYGGSEGEIPEPTTGAVNDFFTGMRVLIKEIKPSDLDGSGEEMDGDEMAEALDSMDEKMAEASEYQARSVALISGLCQGEPSVEDLTRLPLRVLRAFTKWLIGEINPKDEKEGATIRTLPAPQDHRTASRGSRKVKR